MKSTLLATMIAVAIVLEAPVASADMPIFNGKREGDTPEFLPTVAIAVGIDGAGKDDVYGSFWLGASHYPTSRPWSPFYSAGIEMDLRTTRDSADNTSTVPIFGPQLRGGISYFPDNNGFLSLFNAYGLLSYRAPSAFEGHVFRFGVGISSPGIGLIALTARVPLPWMVEGVCDVTENGLRPSVRVGFSY